MKYFGKKLQLTNVQQQQQQRKNKKKIKKRTQECVKKNVINLFRRKPFQILFIQQKFGLIIN